MPTGDTLGDDSLRTSDRLKSDARLTPGGPQAEKTVSAPPGLPAKVPSRYLLSVRVGFHRHLAASATDSHAIVRQPSATHPNMHEYN